MTLLAAKMAFLAKPVQGRRWILAFGLIVSILFSLGYIFQPAFLNLIDNKWYDLLLQSGPQQKVSEVSLVVEIDEKSLAQFGQWPWPRYRIALLLEKLQHLGARSIALDMVFPEADRTSLDELQKELQRDWKTPIDFSMLSESFRDNDRLLAHTLSQGPFVLGHSFRFTGEREKERSCHLHPISVAVRVEAGEQNSSGSLFRAQGVVCNLPLLSEAAGASGFFNAIKDPDGVLRRAPLLIAYNERLYPSLALAAYIRAYGAKQVVLNVHSGTVESIVVGETAIPVDARGSLLIHYRGKAKSFPFISAGDILLDRVSSEQVADKIVFIGSTAVGTGELHAAPLDSLFPGTEVHTTLIDNIFRKDFLSRPHWVLGFEFLCVFGSGLISTLLLAWTGAAWSFLVLAILGAGLFKTMVWIFQAKAIVIHAFLPLATLTVNFLLLTSLKYRQEEQKVKARSKELTKTQAFTIQCLAALTETRDSDTGGHILRCQCYTRALAKQLAVNPKFSKVLTDETIDWLYRSAPLHDIGKVGIADRILLKPGKLTEAEFEEMKKHTVYGRNAIETALQKFGEAETISNQFLQFGKEMAYSHHEKWDGSGYPEGLSGDNISLLGRIMAIADVYDALISKRPYKPAFTHEKAVSIITKNRGTHFDPDLVDAFLKIQEDFRKIAIEIPDAEK